MHESLRPLLAANRFEPFDSIQSDVFWVGTALEVLLDAHAPKGKQIAQSLKALFCDHTTTATTWRDRHGGARQDARFVRWAEEMYDHRSAVHGQPAATSA